jgi:hypothetical protein
MGEGLRVGKEMCAVCEVQFVISWIAILFLNGAKCEIDTRTFIFNLIFI